MRGARAPAMAISPSSRCYSHLPSFINSIFAVRRCFCSRRLHSPPNHRNDPRKQWDGFYKRHQNKFFKDRHYLEKDWGKYFSGEEDGKVVLEVGCGAGNTIFPLLAKYPKLYVHACDFSPNAVGLVKSHAGFEEDRVNAFVCDVTDDNLCENILPSSVDVVTLIFALSAVSPDKMPLILHNIKRVLKPNAHVLVRDYAVGDFAQVKLQSKNQMIGKDFYVRGDGTCSYYFSEDFLSTLFKDAGFNTGDISIYCKQIENRLKNVTMDRRWVRGIFNLHHKDPRAALAPQASDPCANLVSQTDDP